MRWNIHWWKLWLICWNLKSLRNKLHASINDSWLSKRWIMFCEKSKYIWELLYIILLIRISTLYNTCRRIKILNLGKYKSNFLYQSILYRTQYWKNIYIHSWTSLTWTCLMRIAFHTSFLELLLQVLQGIIVK